MNAMYNTTSETQGATIMTSKGMTIATKEGTIDKVLGAIWLPDKTYPRGLEKINTIFGRPYIKWTSRSNQGHYAYEA